MSIPSSAEYPLPGVEDLPQPSLHWSLDPDRAVLLIHDMQRYFLAPYATGFAPLVDNIARVRALGLPTVYTAQPPRQDPASRGLLVDRWGPGLMDRAEIVDALAPRDGDVVLTKHRYSAFVRSDLAQRMSDLERDQLVIVGVYAHIGITATALDAFGRDIKPFVVADAVADFTRQHHLAALSHLAATCAVVTTVDRLTGGTGPSLESVRNQVIALLDEPVGDDDDLIDAGLDSIRLMGLIEDWRAGGITVDFPDLAENPTIAGFHRTLVARR